MKYLKQFTIILTVTCIGEILKYLIDLPVPGGIYGLVLLLFLLIFRVIKLEQVKEAGEFLIEIMPVMFIPAAVGLVVSWEKIRGILIPLCVIISVSTFLVMGVTGKTTDFMMDRKGRKEKKTR